MLTEHQLSKERVMVVKSERVCVCVWSTLHGRWKGAKTLKDELDLRLHHFSKSLLKKVEKDNFYRTKAEKHMESTDLHQAASRRQRFGSASVSGGCSTIAAEVNR